MFENGLRGFDMSLSDLTGILGETSSGSSNKGSRYLEKLRSWKELTAMRNPKSKFNLDHPVRKVVFFVQ